jgi:hypothetical protein
MDLLRVDTLYQPLFRQLGLASCSETISFFSDNRTLPAARSFILTKVVTAGDTSVLLFFKQYNFPTPSWKFWGRSSKAKREYENYAVFDRLGIASAERVACGEQRDGLGRLKRAFIITRGISNTSTLVDFLANQPSNGAAMEAKRKRKAIIEQLAGMMRRIHDAEFFHHDLFWRNILVQTNPGEAIKVWWIDCPRGKFTHSKRLQYRHLLRDIAALDLSAETCLTPRDRIAFLKLYLGQQRLDAGAKKLIADALAYRKKHWAKQ